MGFTKKENLTNHLSETDILNMFDEISSSILRPSKTRQFDPDLLTSHPPGLAQETNFIRLLPRILKPSETRLFNPDQLHSSPPANLKHHTLDSS